MKRNFGFIFGLREQFFKKNFCQEKEITSIRVFARNKASNSKKCNDDQLCFKVEGVKNLYLIKKLFCTCFVKYFIWDKPSSQ